MILQRFGNSDAYTSKIDGNKIATTISVDLLGIHIDNKLTFDDHMITLCNKASMQKQLEVIVNSFIYTNFNNCPFSIALRKLENIH